MTGASDLAGRLHAVQERVAAACRRVGRAPEEVALLCVTKTVEAARVRQAYEAGARRFGENYAQELRDKALELADLPGLEWHFIGALQRNKVKYVVGTARWIQTIDSPTLLEAVDRRAAQAGPAPQEVLVEVNIAGEQSKSGVSAAELEGLLDRFTGATSCRCAGLMTMPPFFDEPERARPYFADLRRLRDRLSTRARSHVDLRHLSMGMSGDFEVAIEEGATIVRVGTAIFGPRPAGEDG